MHKYTIIDELRNKTIEVSSNDEIDIYLYDFARAINRARDVNNDQPKLFEFGGIVYDADYSIYQLFEDMVRCFFGKESGITVAEMHNDNVLGGMFDVRTNNNRGKRR